MDKDWKASLYARYVSSGQGGTGATSDFLQQSFKYSHLIKTHMPPDTSVSILDLGCGDGGLIFFLKRFGYRNVKGVDLSPEMVALAHGAGVMEAQVGDVFESLAAAPDGSVDVVFAMDILEHLNRPELFTFCREVFRVLSPSGRFIVHVPNAAGIFGNAVRYGDLTHEQAFTDTSMRQIMRSIGFAHVNCYEDRPHPHGVKSTVRAVLWAILSLPFRALYVAETGRLQVILSQNMTAVALRSGDRC